MYSQSNLLVTSFAKDRGRENHAKRQADPSVMAKLEASVLDNTKNGWSRLGAWDRDEQSPP